MVTNIKYRPVALEESQLHRTVMLAEFEIGIREQADQIGLAARLQKLIDLGFMHRVVPGLYMAGQYSRRSSHGHGYIRFTPEAIVVPQTDWAAADAYSRGESADDGQRPDVQILLSEPIEQTLADAGV